jgi:hypothetical protein
MTRSSDSEPRREPGNTDGRDRPVGYQYVFSCCGKVFGDSRKHPRCPSCNDQLNRLPGLAMVVGKGGWDPQVCALN